ncbi:MAG TPA: phosphatidate cytidylyltransferase [Vicinamibacterales bacterium]
MLRIASAVPLIAIVAGTIWWVPWWGTLLLAVVAAGFCGRELGGLAVRAGAAVPPLFAGIASAAATLVTGLQGHAELGVADDALIGLLLLTMIAAGLVALASGPPSPATLTRAGVVCLAPLYIGLPLGAIARSQALFGPAAVTWFIAIMAISDTAQFYAGRLIGIRKLAPLVSPAKTVEGAAGGFAATAIAGAALAAWGAIALEPIVAAMLAVLLAGIGMCGDLFESMLKRSAGVKDSAAVIPGHGGVLDRLDSYLFAGPVFYLFMRFVA